jgi:hypothetical protein
MPGDTKEERRGTSWARATHELRRLRHRIEAVGGSKDQREAGVWHMEKEQWVKEAEGRAGTVRSNQRSSSTL